LYRSLSRSQAITLAVVVLGGLVLGVLGLFAAGSRHWIGDAFQVRAGFHDVGGVEVGTRVGIQGLDAGEVAAIEPPTRPGADVMLRLRIAGKYRSLIGADARVEIAAESLFSGKVVRILPGSAGAPPVADDAVLAGAPSADLTDGLTQATVKLNKVLVEADSTLQGVQHGKGTLGKLLQDEKLYNDLTSTLAEVKGALQDVRNGEGTLGKLVKNNDVYSEALKSLQDVRQMVSSVKQNSDAIKALPVVRNYVVDASKELIRPDCKRYRKWFPESDLFDPGRAVLTDKGKQKLDKAAIWLNHLKPDGSEVVVAAFADLDRNAEFAQNLTQKQSEVVIEYLKTNHHVHRTGFWWFDNRSVRAIGCGVNPPPVPEKEKLPPARVELLVFVPQN
jgi:phospholipid/cholesterol/gamma-HCH transport system substrate-binding protein